MLRACMSCGAATRAEVHGDDGRFTGKSITVYVQIDVAPEHLRWLAQWPRVTVQRQLSLWPMAQTWMHNKVLYLPSKLRCKTPEQLAAKEAELREKQHAMTTRECLRECGLPADAPPADLPTAFTAFASTWQDLQLTPQTDPHHLITRTREDSVIAAELLMQRDDANEQLMEVVREGWLDVALLMLRATSRPPSWLEKELLELLDAVQMTPRGGMPDRIQKWPRVELALIIAFEQRLNSKTMTTAVRALMRKVARHDATLVDRIRETLCELEQPPVS